MKTAIILSDSHGNKSALQELNGIFAETDYIIHLGDYSADGGFIKKNFPEKTFVINGNCDPYKLGEDEIVLEIEGVKIFACHGHKYGVKSGIDRLIYRSEELGCSLALYGHTHEAKIEEYKNVTAINPGTLGAFYRKTYCYLVIHNGKPVAKLVEI